MIWEKPSHIYSARGWHLCVDNIWGISITPSDGVHTGYQER